MFALAGFTPNEARAYMAELADYELDGEQLKKVAGGDCYNLCHDCPNDW